MKVLLFLAFIFVHSAGAQGPQKFVSDIDSETDDIAENLKAGAFLIYDCKEKHWACVTEINYKECSQKRALDLASVDDPYHTCATFEKFPNKKSCFQRQLYLTTHHYGQRFCIKELLKDKNIDF